MRGQLPTLASQLNHLLEVVPGPNGERYTNETFAEALTAAGVPCSPQHVRNLRAGRSTNPSASLVQAIASVCGVTVNYFFDADVERRANQQLEMLSSLRDQRVHGLMLRAHGLSGRHLDMVMQLVESIRAEEGLD